MPKQQNKWLKTVTAPDGSIHVMARKTIQPGRVVFRLPKEFTDVRARRTIEVGPNKHQAETGDIDDYINHSCEPNLRLVEVSAQGGKYVFEAIAPIRNGDEVTWDYETYETVMSEPFTCHCGSDKCRGEIVGSQIRRST